MPSPYLSKSDFKACCDCRTKLFYRKNSYATNLDENEYLKFLADGGFMIETVAKAQYPTGVDLVAERDPQRAFARTHELLNASPNTVVFEAAAIWGKFYARIDVLRREGNTLHLIEVKSSSIDAEVPEDDAESPFLNAKGAVSSKWREYLLDVAFQARLLRHAFPAFQVKPWLCVVNKGHRATANETMAHFRVVRDEQNPRARPEVIYSGDLQKLRGTGLLAFRDVTAETDLLAEEVATRSDALALLLDARGGVTRVQEPIAVFYKSCRSCEYRFQDGRPPAGHGFAECWGQLAGASPHILNLHRVGQIGSSTFPDPVPALLAQGRASLLDLTEDELGKPGTRQERRHLQWSHSVDGGSEHLPRVLQQTLRAHKTSPGWPLHFLDFEACNVALPYHAGLRPYERVAFQWSCHTVDASGQLAHAEWLNTDPDFPNFAFAASLRQHLGEHGTVYVWSPYEQSTLNRVLIQIEEWVQRDAREALRVSDLPNRAALDALATWIDRLLGPADANSKRHSPRIRDLHQLALAHYFHPAMQGRTSIKVVLPAVWRSSDALRTHPWFAAYLQLDAHGVPRDPYKSLSPLPLGDAEGDENAITDGTGAIRVYQDLIFRREPNPQFRENRRRLLLQYCQLDTAAMVMIWKHWTQRTTGP
jgi:hypothetical protein